MPSDPGRPSGGVRAGFAAARAATEQREHISRLEAKLARYFAARGCRLGCGYYFILGSFGAAGV
jgi:hypothetical protein